ncbi:nitrate reductase molybdenum cofactor assembly chaperone [Spirillospora sp. NPDC127200]
MTTRTKLMKPPALTDAQRAVIWQAVSLLLAYPDQELLDRRPLLRRAAAESPAHVGALLDRFLDHVDATPLTELAAEYVATFDQRKRCCLELTYYSCGNTRKRGMALLQFKTVYAATGLMLRDEELPDHLSVVLEFAATGDAREGMGLLTEHRAGLELLRLALDESGSPWTSLVKAVVATLPPAGRRDHDTLARLIAEGPPEEQVGLPPFGGAAPAQPGPVLVTDRLEVRS